MLHIPILRGGRPYRSVEVVRAIHHRTREPLVEYSQANPGLIRKDILQLGDAAGRLAAYPSGELLGICARAAGFFGEGELPLGDSIQTVQDYVEQTSATTGLPWVMVRRNLEKIRGVMANMAGVLRGLTRNLDLEILDRGFGETEGFIVSYYRRAHSLGVVLPSNSPGVHSLWAPAFALKTPLVLKPGSSEPWTPYRMIQAFLKAGAPPEAFGYYPTDHAGAGEILRHCDRGMVFGDVSSTRAWAGDPRIEVHGPGWSKIVIGEDLIDEWPRFLDVMVTSILENSGRSCVNASGVWAPRHAAAIAEALAERLAKVVPRDAADPEAQIAPFADAGVAARTNALIEQGLAEPGARDLAAAHRGSGRLVYHEGCAYLLPTIVLCDSPEHPLANKEYLFPYASVVEAPESSLPGVLGPTLVLTAITANRRLQQRLLGSPLIGRLNFGSIPTNRIVWDQPHEGNLFDHLYARRAFQAALEPALAS